MKALTKLTLILALAMICAGGTSAAQAADNEHAEFVALMNSYLDVSNKVVDLAGTPEAAIYMAVEGIVEVYEQRRDGPAAEQHLRRILDEHGSNQTIRNLVRFKLRDIYNETGQTDKALAELDAIIAENARAR